MTRRTNDARLVHPAEGHDARRNFILQQGFPEPTAITCPRQYSALLFQPRVIGLSVVAGSILQAPLVFFAVMAVLWWSALLPRLNPFDALYNRIHSGTNTLRPAPAPRRFAQFMAGSFALAIGLALMLAWHMMALVLEGFFIVAVGALVFGGFCLGSLMFHVLCGRVDFARRSLPWASGV
jgi:Domain of unknown function (DUF4395)